jgi:translation initiation factor IF-3
MRKKYNINKQIQANKINLVLSDGKMEEGILLTKALSIAEGEGVDVVEVSINGQGGLPVCKILDYGKMMYKQSKKRKSNKQILHKKEIKYSYNISDHDLGTKHDKIFKFLAKKYMVSYILELKGREKHLIDSALDLFKEHLKEFEEVATWKNPDISTGGRGARISTVLQPK